MERFLSLFYLIFSLSAHGAVPASTPSIGIGATGALSAPPSNVPLSNPSDSAYAVFSIYAGDNSALTAGNFYPFYKNGSQYRVSSGVKAYCFNNQAFSSGATNTFQLVSSLTFYAFNAGSLTAGGYQSGAAAKYIMITGSISVPTTVPGIYTFDALSYPGIQPGANAGYTIRLDCYEK